MNKKALLNWLESLYKPFYDSVRGKLSWKEWVSAVMIAVLYFMLGGDITNLFTGIAKADPHTINEIVSAVFVLVITLFHKKWQGTDEETK